jgi:hypothetical protein
MNMNNKAYSVIGLIFCFNIVFLPFAEAINDGSRYAKKSALASGKWIQIQVKENAVYKLTYDDIKKMGIDDPAKVKIYGYGGWMLEEDFTKPYIDDLPEVSVWMSKGSDGVFNSGDFLLFYGRGTIRWTYNKNKNLYEHANNPYSTFGSYFLTESDTGPKIMEEINLPPSSTATELTTFDDYILHEKDEKEVITTGRLLFGENFIGRSTQQFSFSIPGITSDEGKARITFAGAPPQGKTAPLSLLIDNVEMLNLTIAHPGGEYQRATFVDRNGNWTGDKKEQTTITVQYNTEGQSIAYLDYIALNMKRHIRFYNTGYTFFRNKESLLSPVKYTIENAGAQSLIWDVTGNFDTKLVKTTGEGNKLTFGTSPDNVLHEYVMVDFNQTFPIPALMKEINNQDLHGRAPIDYVIIAPEVYAVQAEQLAEQHRKDGLKVAVVQPEWIYNEFSSGAPDASAYRRFMKMFYDRAVTADRPEDKPKYLLLFGDGLFDNRFLTSVRANADSRYYLLTFQMIESVNESYSFGTDDYFGFLNDNEGVSFASDSLNIGIGRFPVSSVAQAENAVKKVIGYMNNRVWGEWKNRIISTSDNADFNSMPVHADQANKVAQYIETNHPQYMITKSYMDAFTPTVSNGKTTFPSAKKKFLETLNKGCFLLNYTGHGSKTAWSGEDMLNIVDVRKMNFEGLPLWITATCDFGWFDGNTTSGGEEAFLNSKGGAIALFTTSRVVYSTSNFDINKELVQNIFSKFDGKRPRLGDIARRSKNKLSRKDTNKLNYVLLGDPGMRLSYPELNVELEKINGEAIDENQTYAFRIMDQITLEGKITDANGNIVTDFNGTVKMTLFDGKQITKAVAISPDKTYFTFPDYPNRIFFGTKQVSNGKFSISFTVPLDIAYSNENGKINLYAYDEELKLDANGNYDKFRLTGSDGILDVGEGAPEIKQLFLNSEAFRNGDNVNETPFFVARVNDENGINTTGNGLGHDITICIDNSAQQTYSLNSYFIPDDKAGEVQFSIPELKPGEHQLVFKVWNILNHSSSDTLRFNVVKGLKPNLYDITATSMSNHDLINFRLVHDRPESTIEVEIFVYDLMGRPIWSHKETGSSSWLRQYEIEWNLTDSGKRVEQGVYIYSAIINAPEGKETIKAKKIIILRQ